MEQSNVPNIPKLTDELLSTLDKCVGTVCLDLMEHKESDCGSAQCGSEMDLKSIASREYKMEMKEDSVEISMVKVTDIGANDELLQQLGEENNQGLLWKLLLRNTFRDKETQFVEDRIAMYKQWFQMDIGKWIYQLGHWRQRVYADMQDWDKSPQPPYRPFSFVPPPRPAHGQFVRPVISAVPPAAQAFTAADFDPIRRRSMTNNSSPVMDSPPSSPSYVDSLEL